MHFLFIPLLLGTTLQVSPSVQSPQIRLELQCRQSGDLLATIHNQGTADTAVIVGAVLGNGAKYMVGHLSLSIRTDGQSDYFRMYRPSHYPARIGGRLDDWIVPLPVGASYALQLQASDFEGWRSITSFPASTLAVRLEVRRPSVWASADAKLFRVWTEKDALVSNEVHVPDECR
jgi:hypothetical protein